MPLRLALNSQTIRPRSLYGAYPCTFLARLTGLCTGLTLWCIGILGLQWHLGDSTTRFTATMSPRYVCRRQCTREQNGMAKPCVCS